MAGQRRGLAITYASHMLVTCGSHVSFFPSPLMYFDVSRGRDMKLLSNISCRTLSHTQPMAAGSESAYATVDEAACEANRQFLAQLDFVQVHILYNIHSL